MIAAERAPQSSSNRFDADKDSLKMGGSANFASDSVQKKKRQSEARPSVKSRKLRVTRASREDKED